MTKTMQAEVLSYLVLKVLGYTCGILGAVSILGFAGSLEWGHITMSQCLTYEFYAIGLIGLSYVMYCVRELIRRDFYKRARHNKI